MSGAASDLAVAVPVLETERLRLRAHRADDHAALSATWADPLVYRFLSGQPTSPPDAWMRLLRYGGLWSMLGYGYWAVEEKASGQLIGDIGYADFRRGMTPSLDGMPELGWVLPSHAHGKGYASEALAAVQAWGDSHFGTLVLHHRSGQRRIDAAGRKNRFPLLDGRPGSRLHRARLHARRVNARQPGSRIWNSA